MKYTWADFKQMVTAKGLQIQSTMGTSAYYLTAFDGPMEIRTSIFIPSAEQVDYETNFLILANKQIDKRTSNQIPKFSMYEPEGDAATIVSHDFTDPCTWYQGSLAMANEALTQVGVTLTYKGTRLNWIDLKSGRIYDEDNILAQNPTYQPEVKVAGVVVTTGFTINPKLGEVTFTATPAGAVTASYRYADKSWFIVKPKAGKVLSIKSAEVQFSSNVVINNPFYFEAWVNHPQAGFIPVPGSRVAYKNAKDFISACNGGQGLIPKWSGLAFDVHVFPFQYARPKPIKASQAVEIRVYCLNHAPIVGEFATCTFYVNVDNEVL